MVYVGIPEGEKGQDNGQWSQASPLSLSPRSRLIVNDVAGFRLIQMSSLFSDFM